ICLWFDYCMAILTQALLNKCQTTAEALRCLDRSISSYNYKAFKKEVVRKGLVTSHFKGRAYDREAFNKIELEDILVENSTYTSRLKQRLVKEGLLEDVCALCGQGPYWNGKPLVLQIDHINGKHRDNRIENLRILCPNCHTQTETHSGKANRKKRRCSSCGTLKKGKALRCLSCSNQKKAKAKIEWPATNELVQAVKASSFSEVGRGLGVSDDAIRKRLRVHGTGLEPATNSL